MSSLVANDIEGKVMDHLGLVAVNIEELGIVEKVNAILPLAIHKGVKATMGQRVAAMILNGLGFMDDRLYLFQKFLENKPIDRLIGGNVKAEHFTDDALGRCLDAIAKYGTTKFFTEISFAIGVEKNLIGNTMRGDTTTLLVYGNYPEEENPSEDQPRPKNGHSKVNRSDLKQMILHLATTGSAGFPVWMEAHSGNASDKKTLIEAAKRIEEFRKQLDFPDDFLYVGDSAMYNNAVKQGGDMKWLSRVPENIKEAKAIVELPDEELKWIELSNGYRMQCFDSQYGGVTQRWVLINSQQAFDREIKTLERNITKENEKATKVLWHLSNEIFSCETDARKAIKKVEKFKYHQASFEVKAIMKHSKPGRPQKDSQPKKRGFKIDSELLSDENKIELARRRKGRFILGTNELDNDKLCDTEILARYKEQSSTEGGFQFIKDRAFEVDSIFLKKPARIEALMAVMCLCLMVYGYAQYQLRNILEERDETLTSQSGKETKKPRMKWVFRLFHGVHVVKIRMGDKIQEFVINLSLELKHILSILGDRAMEIYSFSPQPADTS